MNVWRPDKLFLAIKISLRVFVKNELKDCVYEDIIRYSLSGTGSVFFFFFFFFFLFFFL